MNTYNYLLIRDTISDHAVPGTLYINGNRVCDTLEPANCCLRAGTYKIIIEDCPRTNKKLIRVLTPWQEEDCCQRCAEREHERKLCHRNFYRKLGELCAENIPQDEMDQREDILNEERQNELTALGTPLPCPNITHGTGAIGLPGGTILLGELPDKIELGDKKIQLPILRNSREHYRQLLDRLSKTLKRGDQVTLTIRG